MRSGWAVLTASMLAFGLVGTVVAQSPEGFAADQTAARDAVTTDPNLLGTSDSTLTGPFAWRPADATSTSARISSRPPVAVARFTDSGPAAIERGAPGTVRVIARTTYTGSFLARAATVPTKISATLSWYDGAGRQLTVEKVSTAPAEDSRDRWTRYTVVGLAPIGAASVTLGSTLQDARAGSEHYYASSSLTARAQGSTALAGPLTTRGNTIRDANGAVVVLRGFNRAATANDVHPAGLTEHDIARMKAWGGNVVRFTLSQQVWLPGCPAYRSSYRAAVDRVVDWVTRRGMLVVLDLQYGAPTCTTAGLTPMPDRGSQVFWRQVAARYADHPLVAFDLFNEPHDVSDVVWRDGGTATTADGTVYKAVGMQALLDTVRGLGADNLVLVGGLDYASTVPSTAPLRGRNLVYAAHAYNCALPWHCNTNDARGVLARFVEIGRTTPVMISEFGHPTSHSLNGAMWNASAIAYAEKQGWSWSAWAWHSQGRCARGDYFSLLSPNTCDSATGTFQPSPTGIPVLAGLSRNSD